MDKPTVKQIIKWLETEIASMEKHKAMTEAYNSEVRTLHYVRDFLNAMIDKRRTFNFSESEK